MRATTSLLALSSLTAASAYSYRRQVVTGRLGDATQNLDNPMGAAYQAVIPKGQYGTITGSVVAVAAGDKGTEFAVNLSGLPTEGGPFVYHIHVAPVPSDGNCTGTLAHLDPYERGEVDPCTADRPETCQVGDLAGKHGKINGTSASRSYTDPYVSLRNGEGAFFGNRSLTVHFANKTRIACANFSSISNAQDTGMIGLKPNTTNPALTTLVPFTNGTNAAATSIPSTPSPTPTGNIAQVSKSSATSIELGSNLILLSSLLAGIWTLV